MGGGGTELDTAIVHLELDAGRGGQWLPTVAFWGRVCARDLRIHHVCAKRSEVTYRPTGSRTSAEAHGCREKQASFVPNRPMSFINAREAKRAGREALCRVQDGVK